MNRPAASPALVHFVLCLTLALLAASPAAAQRTGSPAADGLPPLIDREYFFGDVEIAGASLSPDGRYMAFLRPFNGVRNIWVKGIDEPFDAARPVTADATRPISNYLWSRDSRFVLFVQDQGGDENFNVFAVDPAAAVPAGENVPPAHDLTGLTGVRVQLYAVPKSEPDVLYVGLNDRDPAWHDLYKLTISSGERELLRSNTDRLAGWVFDVEDQLRLAVRSANNGDTEILRVDDDGFTLIYRCNVLETCAPARFHEDGRRAYMRTNVGDDVDLTRLVLLDVETGAEELVESDPENRVDLGGVLFSDRTHELLATVYTDAKPRFYWKNDAWETDYEFLLERLGTELVGFVSGTEDERLYLVSASADVEPGEVYLFDRENGELTLQYSNRPEIPRAALAAITPISYPSSDGLEIPAYLTLPKGVEPRGLPLIVVPHGGPWARDTWGYRPLQQFLANRGFAVLTPNFRGSTGYGKRFLDAGNGQWGELMQDDITWGVRHLIDEGVVDPERVAIMGISYGGYATLAGLAFTPDVYAAGVSYVGPSNLITLLDAIPPYWEAGRITLHTRMADPSTPEGRAQLERQSPLNSAQHIKAPLLVIQGANDPRVAKRESEQIVAALHARGFAVEYLLAPDEGHGFVDPVNNLAAMAAAEAFLARHVGTRYQESMTPEVAARSAALTVDPASVEPPPLTETPTSMAAPARELRPGKTTYRNTIEAGGQTFSVESTLSIEDGDDTWLVTETAAMPGAPLTDQGVLAKDTLALVSRSLTQGPVGVEYRVEDRTLLGEMRLPTQVVPISIPLEASLVGDGPGVAAVIAALPLADGYRASLQTFDVQRQRVGIVDIAVVGSERVEVPAGAFETFKVAIDSDQSNGTVWVAKDVWKAVKSTMNVRMSGAVVTSEML